MLQRSLYGLKQSPRMWYRRLREFLVQIKFKENYSDPSLFIYNNEGDRIYLFTYVDDIVITGSSSRLVKTVIEKMGSEFTIKELEDLRYFLGIHRTEGKIMLSQQQYLRNLLASCGYTNLNLLASYHHTNAVERKIPNQRRSITGLKRVSIDSRILTISHLDTTRYSICRKQAVPILKPRDNS